VTGRPLVTPVGAVTAAGAVRTDGAGVPTPDGPSRGASGFRSLTARVPTVTTGRVDPWLPARG
jgi:hypothetical protein